MILMLSTALLFSFRGHVQEMNERAIPTNAAILNSVMAQYRSRVAQGFYPSTPWNSHDRDTLLAELKKPMSSGMASISLLSAVDFSDSAQIASVRPRDPTNSRDDFSLNAVWFPSQ